MILETDSRRVPSPPGAALAFVYIYICTKSLSHDPFASLQVQLTIRTLPELPAGAKYQCVWGSAPPADALVTATGLTCMTPARAFRPPIPPHHDHVLVPLAVRSSETNKDFVSRNFAFYDCSRHNTCGSCVRSDWACNWCVYENTCTHNASTCSGNVVSGENVSILQLLREVCGPG